jgi:hypothetical protein
MIPGIDIRCQVFQESPKPTLYSIVKLRGSFEIVKRPASFSEVQGRVKYTTKMGQHHISHGKYINP